MPDASAPAGTGSSHKPRRGGLTAAAVERIKPPAAGQIDHFDKGYPGLALRVSYGGRKAWTYFYRLHGKQRRHTLGTFPAMTLGKAREEWRAARESVAKGLDPAAGKAAAKRQGPDTVRDVGEQFIEKWHRPRNRTAGEIARMFEIYLYPEIGDRDIRTITRRDILDLLDKAAERGAGVRVNRVLSATHRMFGWAVERDIIDASPVTGIRAPVGEKARDRVLADDEIRAFWKACVELGDPFGPMFRLLLLTGQRRDEVACATWAEVDLREKVWRLPGNRTKNGRAHDVPLSTQVVALIEALPSKDESDLLFPARFARIKGDEATERSASGFTRAKRRLDTHMLAVLRAAAIKSDADPDEVKLPAWRLHDLRRTAASGMARLGVAVHVVEKLLNHVSGTFGGIVGIYQRHDFAEEKRTAAQAWADQIDRLHTATHSMMPTP